MAACTAAFCARCDFSSTADTRRASVFGAPSGLGQNSVEAASQSELLIGVALMSVLQLPRLGSALAPPSHTANRRKRPTRAIFLCCMECVFLINQLASLATHVELDSVQGTEKRRQMGQERVPVTQLNFCYNK